MPEAQRVSRGTCRRSTSHVDALGPTRLVGKCVQGSGHSMRAGPKQGVGPWHLHTLEADVPRRGYTCGAVITVELPRP